MNLSMMHLPGGIHLVLNGRPVNIAKTDKHYEAVCQTLKEKSQDTAQQILDIIEGEKRRMEAAIVLTPNIQMNGGALLYKGEPVAGVLGERMLAMLDEGFDLAPMAAFLENLMQNPSRTVVINLYQFLEVGKNTITEDGYFLAYKAVRADFRDIHSNTFDNSVGQILEMPRNRVDENRNQTCSYGFHVCSFDYLPSFANADGHVMVCKVNPRDVVAIPSDYNDTKMRVCRYEVIGEVTDYYKRNDNVLAAASVAADNPFAVEVIYREDGEWELVHSFSRLSEAAAEFERLVEDESAGIYAVRVRNDETDAVIDEREGLKERDDDDREERTYQVVGISSNARTVLGEDFTSMEDALVEAIQYQGYASYVVEDDQGNVVKTIS